MSSKDVLSVYTFDYRENRPVKGVKTEIFLGDKMINSCLTDDYGNIRLDLQLDNEYLIKVYFSGFEDRPWEKKFIYKKGMTAVMKHNDDYAFLLYCMPVFEPPVKKLPKKSKGSLVIIGGNEWNEGIFEKIIELAGGPLVIKIAIIPAASNTPAVTGQDYVEQMVSLGVPLENVWTVPIAVVNDDSTEEDESLWKDNGFNKSIAAKLKGYNAIFFVGGDQFRYMKTLTDDDNNDSPVLKVIRKILDNGGIIAGTSAGAAIMSNPMIGNGNSYEAILHGIIDGRNVKVDPDSIGDRMLITNGIGFLKYGITDQHFIERGRIGRLIAACVSSGITLGYGISEDSALVLLGGDQIEVIGERGVIVIDTSDAKVHSTYGTIPHITNIKLHYIEEGDRYDIAKNVFFINKLKRSTKDNEYFDAERWRINFEAFCEYGMSESLTYDLVDCKSDQSISIALKTDDFNYFREGYDIYKSGTAMLVFRKGEGTEGFWGRIKGKSSYSVINALVDLYPLSPEKHNNQV